MKLLLKLFLLFAFLISIHAQRGRVQIQNGTLVTDRGTLLRGAYVALDNPKDKMPSRENVTAIKNLGLNSIHVYAENFWDTNQIHPGYNIDKVDSLVSWTVEDSLYMILTFAGGITENNDSIIEFIKDCWDLYADRYRNETHLVYEIYNEPADVPFDSVIIDMEKDVYQRIRSHAPETHILLMSPWNIFYDSILSDIAKLGNGIDWNNASIAGHAYQRPAQDYIEPLNRIKNAGYAITITEFHSLLNKYANLACTRVFEEEFVSYIHFLDINTLDNPAIFSSRIESSEVQWTPDFGTWPENSMQIKYQSPYKYWPAIFYDEGSGWLNDFRYATLEWISDNDYIGYYNINFDESPAYFEILCSSDNGNGAIEIHLDSISGPLVGVCNISNTGGWDMNEYFKCNITTPFDGLHSIYLVFKQMGSDFLFNVEGWYFCKPESLSLQTPYHGVAAVLPGKIEAEEYDYGGLTVSFLDSDTANSGAVLRDDEVDIGITNDEGYCIGWTEKSEWLEYTVSCEKDTLMGIQLRIACTDSGNKLRIKLDDEVLAIAWLPSTGGYYNWEIVTIDSIPLSAGENQILRLELLEGYFNLDWLNFVPKYINGLEESNSIKPAIFYPNPAHDYIRIKTTEPVHLEIYSMLGQLLIKKMISTPDELIPVNNLTSGNYIVKILGEKQTVFDIFVVK